MPELPEVETLRRGLERSAVGQQIAGAAVANPMVLKGQSEAEFQQRVVGRWIGGVARRGKYLLVPLQTDANSPLSSPESGAVALCIHLKMRGQLLLVPRDAEPNKDKHLCVCLLLGDGRQLRYVDPWAWGEIRALTAAERQRLTPLATMGDEPLEAAWGAEPLGKRIEKKRTAIKAALLDQRTVAGVGNIYADEALHRAGIHPERPAGELNSDERERLASAIRSVLAEAVAAGGSQGEFRDLDGQRGKYLPRVYGRPGDACPACAEPLKKIRVAARGTAFCPRCQSRNGGNCGNN